MEARPYHHYIFFEVKSDFYHKSEAVQKKVKKEFGELLQENRDLKIVSYATLGFKAKTTFMLWIRGSKPEQVQDLVRDILHSRFGGYLEIRYVFFGMERASQYSGRVGKPEQIMQSYDDRLPYLVVYPFTKTVDWHLLPFEKRRELMGKHIKVGVGYQNIRQCLIYSYGVSDNEFVVSYEMESLEEFQDLVMELRGTEVRRYTLNDRPMFACVYKSIERLTKWL